MKNESREEILEALGGRFGDRIKPYPPDATPGPLASVWPGGPDDVR